MAHIELKNVSKKFGNQTALRNLDLEIADGEFFVLLGETGAGKTTTLRLVAGLEKPTEGQVFIDGIDVADWGAAERDVALVLQQYSLYPRYTVRQNLEFPLKSKLRRVADAEITERVARVAKTLRIEHLLERKTDRLSGGEMQRVSIGRAIVRNPRVFLMDEPLSALDAKLRETLRTELKNIQMNLGQTFLFVTHDQIEAMSMGDKIGVLNNGRLVQSGTPYEIYNNPKNTFVARSVGSPPMNLLDGRLVSGRAVMTEKTFELPYRRRQWCGHRRPRADLRHPPRGRPGRSRRAGRGHGARRREPRRREDRHAARRRHQPARHRPRPDRRRHRPARPLRMGPAKGRAVRQGRPETASSTRVGAAARHRSEPGNPRPDGKQRHRQGAKPDEKPGSQSRRKLSAPTHFFISEVERASCGALLISSPSVAAARQGQRGSDRMARASATMSARPPDNDLLGLTGIVDHADGADRNVDGTLHRLGEMHLVAGAGRDLLQRRVAAAGTAEIGDARFLQRLRHLDAFLDGQAAVDPVGDRDARADHHVRHGVLHRLDDLDGQPHAVLRANRPTRPCGGWRAAR